jgi:hypothetical protein
VNDDERPGQVEPEPPVERVPPPLAYGPEQAEVVEAGTDRRRSLPLVLATAGALLVLGAALVRP